MLFIYYSNLVVVVVIKKRRKEEEDLNVEGIAMHQGDRVVAIDQKRKDAQ